MKHAATTLCLLITTSGCNWELPYEEYPEVPRLSSYSETKDEIADALLSAEQLAANSTMEFSEQTLSHREVVALVRFGVHKNQSGQTIRNLREFLNDNPNLDAHIVADLHVVIGMLLCESGKLKQAVPHFQKAREANPDNWCAVYHLSEVYWLLHEDELSKEYREIGNQIAPYQFRDRRSPYRTHGGVL